MPIRVEVRRSAEREIREAKAWYRQAGPGLEQKFTNRIREAIDHVRRSPLGFREVYPNVRRIVVKQFPYSVFYVVEAERLVVIGCLHQAKDPARWPTP